MESANAPGQDFPIQNLPFGVFTTALWRELRGFDEALLANEDYDFNYRARRAGATVLLDGAMQSVYRARATFGALARQIGRAHV